MKIYIYLITLRKKYYLLSRIIFNFKTLAIRKRLGSEAVRMFCSMPLMVPTLKSSFSASNSWEMSSSNRLDFNCLLILLNEFLTKVRSFDGIFFKFNFLDILKYFRRGQLGVTATRSSPCVFKMIVSILFDRSVALRSVRAFHLLID